MADNTRTNISTGDGKNYTGWTNVISAVQTPLALIVLILLIVDSVLMLAGAFTDKMPIMLSVGVFVLVLLIVFAIVIFFPTRLYPPRPVTVILLFPDEPMPPSLDRSKCTMEILDEALRPRPQRKPNIKKGYFAWELDLPSDLRETDSVALQLVDLRGRRWTIEAFAPFTVEKQAVSVNGTTE